MNCPFCGSKKFKRNGFFFNHVEKIQKYFCNKCKSHFTLEIENKFEKRQELNESIVKLAKSGLSQRKIADRLGCARWTVQLKLKKYKD